MAASRIVDPREEGVAVAYPFTPPNRAALWVGYITPPLFAWGVRNDPASVVPCWSRR